MVSLGGIGKSIGKGVKGITDPIFGGGGKKDTKKARDAMIKYGKELQEQAPVVAGIVDPYSEYRQNTAGMLNSLVTGTDYYMPTAPKMYDPNINKTKVEVNLTKKQKNALKKANKQLEDYVSASDKKKGKAGAKLTKTLAGLGLSGTDAAELASSWQQGKFTSLEDVLRQQYGENKGLTLKGITAPTAPTTASQPTSEDMANNPAFKKYEWQTDPGYQFRLEEANREVERAAGARGYNSSGNIMAAITQRTQDVASSEYKNIIDRLMTISGASSPQLMASSGEAYGNMWGQGAGAKYGAQYDYNKWKANQDTGLIGKITGYTDQVSGLLSSGKGIFDTVKSFG